MKSKILQYLKVAVTHPVTHINILVMGTMIFIGVIHNNAHFYMTQDADTYVRQWCKSSDQNKEICKRYSR